MKLHLPVFQTILNVLQKVIQQNFYSDKALEYAFKSNKKLGKRDRQIIAETVYNIVRYYYLFEYLTQTNDLIKIIHFYLENSDLKLLQNSKDIPQRIKLSYNEDLWESALQQIPPKIWLTEATALNNPAPLVIRTNTLKTSKGELKLKLQELGVETIENHDIPEALIIQNKQYLSQNELFKQGLYEFQDLSSQKVAHFIPYDILQNAKRIIDACAGAGGKSLHLSALMKNKGQIISLDTDEKKLKELTKRAARAGANNIQIKSISSSKVIKRLYQSADILLLDVPCSGTGVIKRNPDTKLKFSNKKYTELLTIQQSILKNYTTMLKPNGHLLYVTCSIFPEENENQIKRFLKNFPQYQLLKEQYVYPSYGFDGFYMALLEKSR